MKHASLGMILVLAFYDFACSDQEASNVPHISISEGGRCYAKSIPSSTYGNEGETRVYHVGKKEDVFIGAYNWYSNPIYLHCGLGKGKIFGLSIVKFGPWPRGEFPSAGTLAFAFYLSDTLVKSYSTLDIAGSKENRSVSISHYTVIEKVLGYRWIKENEFVFEIQTKDKKIISFDPTNGEILSRK